MTQFDALRVTQGRFITDQEVARHISRSRSPSPVKHRCCTGNLNSLTERNVHVTHERLFHNFADQAVKVPQYDEEAGVDAVRVETVDAQQDREQQPAPVSSIPQVGSQRLFHLYHK